VASPGEVATTHSQGADPDQSLDVAATVEHDAPSAQSLAVKRRSNSECRHRQVEPAYSSSAAAPRVRQPPPFGCLRRHDAFVERFDVGRVARNGPVLAGSCSPERSATPSV
jgi:hypothetical protein